jgi:hypothetical protein
MLLRVSYVTTLIMRDLTTRGVSSFGSFQLLRLYVDELVHVVLEDVYFLLRWPLYAAAHNRVRIMHPLLFMAYESAGVLTPSAPGVMVPPPPLPLARAWTADDAVAAQLPMWGHGVIANGVGAPAVAQLAPAPGPGPPPAPMAWPVVMAASWPPSSVGGVRAP